MAYIGDTWRLGPVALGFPTARSTRRTGKERSPDWRANGIRAHPRRDTGKTEAEQLNRTCRRCDPPGALPHAGDGRECEGLHNPWNQVLPETQNHEVFRVACAIRGDCATFRGRVEFLPVREEIQHSLPPRRRGLREIALLVPSAIARWVTKTIEKNTMRIKFAIASEESPRQSKKRGGHLKRQLNSVAH